MRPMEIRKMASRVSQAKTVDYISEPSENPKKTFNNQCFLGLEFPCWTHCILRSNILPCEEQYSFTLLLEECSLQTSPRAADSEAVATCTKYTW